MDNHHEPGPNGDSETAPSRKPGQKLSQVHEHQNWPSWAHRRAQARACLAVSWALRPCRGLAARSYRGPSGRVVGAGCAPAGPYRRHSAAHWLCCIATQPSLSSLGLPQYNWFVLRYRLPLRPCSLLQYNTLYCNTTLQQPFQPPLSRYNFIVS